MRNVERCILAVEDDRYVRDLYVTLLRAEGYRVETAVDGEDGLFQLRSAPDLILLDLEMPVMDGREFLRRLRQLPDHQRTPVIVITAQYGGAVLAGAQAVMPKPIDIDVLLRRISALLARPS